MSSVYFHNGGSGATRHGNIDSGSDSCKPDSTLRNTLRYYHRQRRGRSRVAYLSRMSLLLVGLPRVPEYSSSIRIINYPSSNILLEYSKRFVSGYHFHFRSSFPVVFFFMK